MKLLFTYFVPSGGIETLNRLRCRALRQVGMEGHLLYLWDGAGRQNITDIPCFVTNDDNEIRAIIQSHRYDAVIVTCDHLMLQRIRGLGYNGPLIYESQGLGGHEQARSTIEFASLFIKLYAQAVISPPVSHMIELFRTYLPGFPRFFVQNMIDTDRFVYQNARWLNPSGSPILAWIGRLEQNKDWQLFLRIGEQVARHLPDVQLWMFEDANISEPGEREKFSRLIHELNLLPRLTLRSNVPHDHMPHYLSAVGDSSGLLLSTSHLEGFGYAVAEAMSCDCPVLSTDSDGVRSFIEHNRTGKFFVTRTISEAVAEALQLINNRPFTDSIRQQAKEHIHALFSPRRYAADIVNVMVELGLRPYQSG
ncbi:glycosyltransferase family 4 protein [Paenibacillus oenotherae]|uniref:Glycosyltransferase family 4 protein n=1 Tax=Paenibacillus oenotherae TaxID=1435645 RepID=A0ABS7D3Y9_9BACL|nr:glycosyltransferase family 4 protein [Paenibacillus oenotherae]MBW7474536.1 glycosyltransferase family 4 protein [Paenibacillus oenotherae]